jgi:hypothetical protein
MLTLTTIIINSHTTQHINALNGTTHPNHPQNEIHLQQYMNPSSKTQCKLHKLNAKKNYIKLIKFPAIIDVCFGISNHQK